MTPSVRRVPRYLGAWASVLLGVIAVVIGVGGGVYQGASEADRAVLGRVLREQWALLVTAVVLAAVLIGVLVAIALRRYVDLPRRLAGDVRVVASSNPEHRVSVGGARELRVLADAIDELAQRYAAARRDVAERVATAAGELEAERNRLAALMGELTVAVLVCAPDGRILLYNTSATALLGDPDGAIGLGRSVFGVVDRDLIAHGLDRLDAGSAGYEAMTESRGGLVRVRLATVPADEVDRGGFVLVCEDATRPGRAAARRVELLRATGERLRGAAGSIGAAAQNVLDYPDMPAAQRERFADVIAAEAAALGEAAARLLAEVDSGSDGGWATAEMSARNLLAAVTAATGRSGGPAVQVVDPAEECWLAVDSFALVGALSWLIGAVGARRGVEVVELAGRFDGDFARLDLSWPGAPLQAGELGRWAAEPEAPDLADVVRRHGGELWADAAQPVVRVLLPATGRSPAIRPAPPSDAVPPAALYDFGLRALDGGPRDWDDAPLDQLRYTVFDTETTGFSPADGDAVVSIGAARIVGGRLLARESFERMVDPGRAVPRSATAVHGISTHMVRGAPQLDEVLPAFAEFARDTVLLGHNVAFDMAFLSDAQRRTGVRLAAPLLDTLLIDGVVHPDHEQHTLEAMADRLGVSLVGRHTALGDALVTGEIFLRLLRLLDARGIRTLGELRAAANATAQSRASDRRYGRPAQA